MVLRHVHLGQKPNFQPIAKPKIEIIDIDMLKMMIPDDDLVDIYDKDIDRSAPFVPGFDFEILGWPETPIKKHNQEKD